MTPPERMQRMEGLRWQALDPFTGVKMSTYWSEQVDDFNTGSEPDVLEWGWFASGEVALVDGRLRFGSEWSFDYVEIERLTPHILDALYFELVEIDAATDGWNQLVEFVLSDQIFSMLMVRVEVMDDALWLHISVNGSVTDIEYDPVEHRWLRFRYDDGFGLAAVDASPDGTSWSLLHEDALNWGSEVHFRILHQNYTGEPVFITIDNFNTLGDGPGGSLVTFKGTGTTSSSAVGKLSRQRKVEGGSLTSASAAGEASILRPVAGTSTTSSSAAGALARGVEFSGTSTTTATAAGAVDVAKAPVTFAGTSTTAVAAAGALSLSRVVGGTSTTTTASLAAPLAREVAFTGASFTSATASGSLDVIDSGEDVTLAGTSTTTASSAGSLRTTRQVEGTSTVASTSGGSFARIVGFSGASTGSPSAIGFLEVTASTVVALSGTSTTWVSSPPAPFSRDAAFLGTSTTAASAIGLLHLRLRLAGTSRTRSFSFAVFTPIPAHRHHPRPTTPHAHTSSFSPPAPHSRPQRPPHRH